MAATGNAYTARVALIDNLGNVIPLENLSTLQRDIVDRATRELGTVTVKTPKPLDNDELIVLDSNTSHTLTPPTGATHAVLQVRNESVRVRMAGDDPAQGDAGLGFDYGPGYTIVLESSLEIANFKAKRAGTSGTAVLYAAYYGPVEE